MRFTSLRVNAFNRLRPYTLQYEPGLIYVEGENLDAGGRSNGSGKSLAVVETLLYVLFGKMSRYDGKLVTDEAAHSINGADVAATLDLRPDYPVTVRRGRAPRGRPSFTITDAQGKLVPFSKDPRRRSDDVAGLLGYDYPSFRAAVVISRGQPLAADGFAAQMTVLEEILRLDELNIAAGIEAKWAAERAVGVTAAKADLYARQRVLEEARRFLDQLNAIAQVDYESELAGANTALAEAEEAGRLAAPMKGVLEDAATTAHRAHEEYTAAMAKSGSARVHIDALSTPGPATACAACGRPYKNVKEIEAQQARRQEDLAKAHQVHAGLSEATQEAGKRYRKLQDRHTATQREYDRLVYAAESVEDLRRHLHHLTAQRDQQTQQRKLAETRVAGAEAAVAGAEVTVQDAEQHQGRAAWWAREFGRDGMQAEIFAAALPVLNREAAQLSRALTGTIEVTFNPLRDSRTEDLIRISGGSAPTYRGLSDGEKELTNLVIAFALRALARWRMPEPVNLLVLDEVVSSVDPVGTTAVLALLEREVQAGTTVFFISHDPEQRKMFPAARRLRVTRDQGEATVAYA